MVVAIYREILGQRLEERKVSSRHVVEAHRDAALKGSLVVGRRLLILGDLQAYRSCHPGVQIVVASAGILFGVRAGAVVLLSHLEETMDRVACILRKTSRADRWN